MGYLLCYDAHLMEFKILYLFFKLCFFGDNSVSVSSYMAPLQGVVSMDGSTIAPAPIQVYSCSSGGSSS